MNAPPKALAAAAVLSLLCLYAPGIFDHDLWTPDEPRVASIARQAAEGAWVAPTLNGVPFLEHPPLYLWCVALFYKVVGYDAPHLARILSTLFCLGGLVWTYLLAAHLAGSARGRRVGLLSVLVLGFSLEYYHTAHRLVTDSALVCFTTASAYFTLLWVSEERTKRRLLWAVLSSLCASLAFLSKSVLGIVLPALVLLAAVGAMRKPRLIFSQFLWVAPLVFSAVTVPWLFFLYDQLGTAGLQELLVDNTLGRVIPSLASTRGHLRPVYYYALLLPVHLGLSLVFCAGGVILRLSRTVALSTRERIAHDTLLIWFLLGVVLLSLAATKRGLYLVPLFPALAVLGGFWLDAFLTHRANGWYERMIGYVLAAAVLVLAALLPLTKTLFKAYCGDAPLVLLIFGALAGAAAGLATLVATRAGKRHHTLAFSLGGYVLVSVCALMALVPTADRIKSLRSVCVTIDQLVPPEHPVCLLQPDEVTLAMMPLYAGRPAVEIGSPAELQERLTQTDKLYLLTVDKTYRKRQRRYESVLCLSPKLLLEDIRPRSRAIRLLLLSRLPALKGDLPRAPR